MALKVLIAAPENDYFVKVVSALNDAGYEATYATTGIDAQILLGQNKYFHILMAYELKQHSAITVMKFVKFNCPTTRLSITISNETIKSLELDNQDLPSIKSKLTLMGAFKVLSGFTEIPDLVSYIDAQQNFNDIVSNIKTTPESERSDGPEVIPDEEFVEIPIEHFFSSAKNIFDVFIKIGGGKYIKILHTGDQFDQNQIKKYNPKNFS